MSLESAMVELRDVTYAYPDGQPALLDVDLRVDVGERVAVLGPNGAGKTTLALHLNGTLVPQRGSVTIGGLPVRKPNLREIRRRVGMVFQDPDDQLFMPRVRDDVAFGPRNLGWSSDVIDEAVRDALGQVGMADVQQRAPHHLSFGQRRRVALATVLAMTPDVLVLDEPSSNLDPMARREFAAVLLGLGLTVIMVTHDLPYALELCPRSVIVNHGRIVADGPTSELLADTALLEANRLALPYGMTVAPPSGDGAVRDPGAHG
jgi:cobalt/nickel transport system ATP-binding protein